MNKQRRKEIQVISESLKAALGNVQRFEDLSNVQGTLKALKQELSFIKGDEEEAFDNLPESLQESRQETLDEFISNMDDVDNDLDQLLDMAPSEFDLDELNDLYDTIQERLEAAQA